MKSQETQAVMRLQRLHAQSRQGILGQSRRRNQPIRPKSEQDPKCDETSITLNARFDGRMLYNRLIDPR
jgi:hypothetical protein